LNTQECSRIVITAGNFRRQICMTIALIAQSSHLRAKFDDGCAHIKLIFREHTYATCMSDAVNMQPHSGWYREMAFRSITSRKAAIAGDAIKRKGRPCYSTDQNFITTYHIRRPVRVKSHALDRIYTTIFCSWREKRCITFIP